MFWILIAIAVFLKFSIKSVPPVHFAVSTFLGERKNTYSEGWHLTVPFLEKFPDNLVISLKVDNIGINFTFPTKDNMELTWEGILEYVPDPEIENPEGHPKITDFTTDDLKKGLRERTQDEVKKLGGSYEANAFKTRFSRALRYFIESIMRLERPPHVNPQDIKRMSEISDRRWKKLFKRFNREIIKTRLAKKKDVQVDDLDDETINQELKEKGVIYKDDSEEEIDVDHRLEFYSVFSGPIGDILRNEENHPNQFSGNEKYYGIDIQNVSNSNIDYTEEMWDALESQKRSEKELEGKEVYHKKAVEMAKEIMEKSDKDMKFGEAYDKALTMLDKASQKNFSFQGMAGKTGMILEVNDNE